ncbi:hypothetical protein [Burkholderia cepacia]|uniref:hypothetical protein n=1 Tax=Burkholderia cepacia TaxID=292 RepID=UPI000A3F2612|nr:hypothetical protein [Burkholderia cepacia]
MAGPGEAHAAQTGVASTWRRQGQAKWVPQGQVWSIDKSPEITAISARLEVLLLKGVIVKFDGWDASAKFPGATSKQAGLRWR